MAVPISQFSQQALTPAQPVDPWSELAPKPTRLEDTGLSLLFLADLLSKHLSVSGVLDLTTLAKRLALPGTIVEAATDFLRAEGRVELRTHRDGSGVLRFGLTERGRFLANDAMQRDGYVGPAPVTLAVYDRAVCAQSPGLTPVTRDRVRDLFADTVIRPDLLDRLGPAVHSCRSVFIYGDAGTGKTFIASRLGRLLGPSVLLPYAIIVGESVIRCVDPSVHRPIDGNARAESLRFRHGFDARFYECQRPVIKVGGELTLDMLELQYDRATHQYTAPLQLQANTGLLIIDDLGRQRVVAEDLLNRWIVPLDEGRDQLMLNTGQHFAVPFEMALVFSTNLNPRDLADEAFLRRMGYKVRFEPSSRDEYEKIWLQMCDQLDIEGGPQLLEFVLREYYGKTDTHLLPCHPRDLLRLAADYARYTSGDINETALQWAWGNYFVAES